MRVLSSLVKIVFKSLCLIRQPIWYQITKHYLRKCLGIRSNCQLALVFANRSTLIKLTFKFSSHNRYTILRIHKNCIILLRLLKTKCMNNGNLLINCNLRLPFKIQSLSHPTRMTHLTSIKQIWKLLMLFHFKKMQSQWLKWISIRIDIQILKILRNLNSFLVLQYMKQEKIALMDFKQIKSIKQMISLLCCQMCSLYSQSNSLNH